jgi:glucosamine-6-phosphate deaminase (EC 3.5.99.6)
MRLIPLQTSQQVGLWSARYIVDTINTFSPTADNPFVLGLPTGGTPLNTYKQLIKLHQQGEISFEHVVTFNMDEYCGIPADHPQAYRTFMYQNFFKHIDIQEKTSTCLMAMRPMSMPSANAMKKKSRHTAKSISLWVVWVTMVILRLMNPRHH